MKRKALVKPAASRMRRHWALAPGVVFLNHGSFGACPRVILDKQAELRRQMEAEPVQFLWRRYEERLDPARAVIAKFVGVRPRDLVFTTNATSGVNAVVRSLRFRAGDEILTTDHDYNACRNALVEAARCHGARLKVAHVPFPIRSEDEVVERVLRAVTRRTRLAMIDHVTSNSAMVWPVGRIIRELAARGVETLVDGAHAPGMLDLDVARLGAAYYTANLHKWVCAPKGAAFVWVREDKQEGIQPPVISHGNNRARPGHTPFQDRFDWVGTFDPTSWLCASEAVTWLGRLLPSGWREVRERNHAVAVRAREQLCAALDVAPPCPAEMIGSMATVPLPKRFQGRVSKGKIDAEQLRLYDEFRIEVPFMRTGAGNELRCVRVSAHLYNSPNEYAYLGEALKRL